MRKLLFTLAMLALATQAWSQYRNPIIPGYHPDPSICRVGDDFYLVNSSFEYFPGVPIYHSKDLVNWEQIGNVLDRDSQLSLTGATSWLGIYAPTIREHEGTFYMITTNVGNGGNFMVTAQGPRGPWSEPIWLEQQGIDPSLWFEGGKCYMMSNPDNTIMLCEIDPATGKQLTESRPLWRGTGGRYPEGPHLYKKDGWYYLLISEGGTELAHGLTIARSRNIYGPYEGNPGNPLFTHCSLKGQDSPIQGTGHGDLVQAGDGSWWLTFLAYRNFGGSYHHMGRETFLAPVEWKRGAWPVVNNGQPIDTLMQIKPLGATQQTQKRHIRTTFTGGVPVSPEWIHIQNPVRENYISHEGRLQLMCSHGTLTTNDHPTFIGRRQESACFEMETRVNFDKGSQRDEAGLSVYQINDGHAEIFLTPTNGLTEIAARIRMKDVEAILAKNTIEGHEATLRVKSDGERYLFEYAADGEHFKLLASCSCTLLSTEVVGGFTGVVLGMYATGDNEQGQPHGQSFALFDYFDYKEQ